MACPALSSPSPSPRRGDSVIVVSSRRSDRLTARVPGASKGVAGHGHHRESPWRRQYRSGRVAKARSEGDPRNRGVPRIDQSWLFSGCLRRGERFAPITQMVRVRMARDERDTRPAQDTRWTHSDCYAKANGQDITEAAERGAREPAAKCSRRGGNFAEHSYNGGTRRSCAVSGQGRLHNFDNLASRAKHPRRKSSIAVTTLGHSLL